MRNVWIIGIVLGGCASLNTRLPDVSPALIDQEQSQQEAAAFEQRSRLQARFYPIADKVLSANSDLCENTRLDIGVVTESAEDFPKKLREAAKRELGLTETPQVTYVRPGSPAEEAGINIGDRLSLNGSDPVSGHSREFEAAINSGQTITIMSGERNRDVVFEPETRCDYQLRLKMSAAINAYANGKAIVMNAGMMNFAASDDELAYVIGHELAHNTQGHIRKTITNFVLSGFATRYTRPFESEADYVGLYYMARAGYDPEGVEDMWRRLAQQSLRPVYKAKTHPTFPTRTVRIKAARDEITGKQSRGEPLVPNPRSDKAP